MSLSFNERNKMDITKLQQRYDHQGAKKEFPKAEKELPQPKENYYKGIIRILKARGAQEQLRKSKNISRIKLGNYLTSELVYKGDKGNDRYSQEFLRRLKVIGVSESKREDVYYEELDKITCCNPFQEHSKDFSDLEFDVKKDRRNRQWVKRRLYDPAHPLQLPDIQQLTLSELILITEEADWMIDTEKKIDDPQLETFLRLASSKENYEAQYLDEFHRQLKHLGIGKEKRKVFLENEQLIIKKYKREQPIDREPWTA